MYLAIGVFAKVLGLPTGAPPETCLDLTPRHPGSSLQTSYPPYQVLPAAGQGRVRLILGSPQGFAYEGFMIFARDIDTGDYVGEFANLPDSARFVECTRGVKVRRPLRSALLTSSRPWPHMWTVSLRPIGKQRPFAKPQHKCAKRAILKF